MTARKPLFGRERRAQFARFGLVGVASTLLYAIISLALIAAGLAAVVASVAAYGLAGLASYLGHKLFTFSSGGAHSVEGPRFVVVNGVGFLVALAAPGVAERFGADGRLGVLAACIAVPAFNFVAMKLYVFSRGRAREGSPPNGLDPIR